MSSKHYGYQLNVLLHGNKTVGSFILPDNIELVTFNRPSYLLTTWHVINIMNVLREKITVSKRLKSQTLASNVSHIYQMYGFRQNDDAISNIRITVYTPESSNVPNLTHNFYDAGANKKIAGFYETNSSEIQFDKANNEYVPVNGFLGGFFSEFVHDALSNNIQKEITTQDLIEYISKKANEKFPGKVIRVFLLCCRPDPEVDEGDENISNKTLQNISFKTISPETKKIITTVKRKRYSPQYKLGKIKLYGTAKRNLKKSKKNGFQPKTRKLKLKSNYTKKNLSQTRKKRKTINSASTSSSKSQSSSDSKSSNSVKSMNF
jgi:hypothetical protein